MLIIAHIVADSLAQKMRLTNKHSIISINGYPAIDTLDIIYAETLENICITAQDQHGKVRDFRVKNDFSTPLGIEVDDAVCLEPIECQNHCIFCFVKQLPPNMRETLYVKDDDYRHSMISGSYITLTNLTENDIERIIRLHISPLYISVHAYDDDIRIKLLGNKKAKNTINIMKRLLDAGISMHTQIVTCEGINDGKVLEDTVNALHDLSDNVLSCAVIPVGLTVHRSGLNAVKTISQDNARRIIDFVEAANKRFSVDSEGFVWASDEMYIIADRKIPPSEYYGDYPQISNGIGLLAQFDEEFSEALNELESNSFGDVIKLVENYNKWIELEKSYRRTIENIRFANDEAYQVAETEKKFGEQAEISSPFALVTGVAFAPILRKYTVMQEQITHIKCNVYAIKNVFFGESVTVAGLITAGDIIKQLKGVITETKMIIPSVMLREFTDTFLDGLTVTDLERELNVQVFISDGAASLVSIITSDTIENNT